MSRNFSRLGRQLVGLACASLMLAPLVASVARGDSAYAPSEPQPCVGRNPITGGWGPAWGTLPPVCKGQFAFFTADNPMLTGPGDHPPFWDPCCSLPKNDMLTGVAVVVFKACPDDYIATGTVWATSKKPWRGNLVHCTRINTERYMLGPKHAGVFWGIGSEIAAWNHLVPMSLMRSNLPLSIRYAAGRRGYADWDGSGCIGLPFGSVLVEAGDRFCDQFVFREFLYRGASGDPSRGTPVKMLPDCDFLSSPFDESPVCRAIRREHT